MKLQPAPKDAMVAAFIAGELDSPQFGKDWARCLDTLGVRASHPILTAGDISNHEHNELRTQLLECVHASLLVGLPSNTEWYQTDLSPSEVGDLRCGTFPAWMLVGLPTRLISTIATNIDASNDFPNTAKERIADIERRIRDGRPVGALIALATSLTGPFVLMEGHHRATAYARAGTGVAVRAFLGVADEMANWCSFGTLESCGVDDPPGLPAQSQPFPPHALRRCFSIPPP
jgi:hypothetical protein